MENQTQTPEEILKRIQGSLDSKDAKEAYAIFAREIPSLTGMLAIDYSPYEEVRG